MSTTTINLAFSDYETQFLWNTATSSFYWDQHGRFCHYPATVEFPDNGRIDPATGEEITEGSDVFFERAFGQRSDEGLTIYFFDGYLQAKVFEAVMQGQGHKTLLCSDEWSDDPSLAWTVIVDKHWRDGHALLGTPVA